MFNREQLLKDFVSKDCDLRPEMAQPFMDNDYVYATDGHIAVRIIRMAKDNFPTNTKGNHAEVLGGFINSLNCFIGKIDLSKLIGLKITTTREMVYDERTCRDCGGKGEYECPTCGQDAECPTCNGKGAIKDRATGRMEDVTTDDQIIKIKDVYSNPTFWILFAKHFPEKMDVAIKSPTTPIHLKNEIVDIICMPMRYDEENMCTHKIVELEIV